MQQTPGRAYQQSGDGLQGASHVDAAWHDGNTAPSSSRFSLPSSPTHPPCQLSISHMHRQERQEDSGEGERAEFAGQPSKKAALRHWATPFWRHHRNLCRSQNIRKRQGFQQCAGAGGRGCEGALKHFQHQPRPCTKRPPCPRCASFFMCRSSTLQLRVSPAQSGPEAGCMPTGL